MTSVIEIRFPHEFEGIVFEAARQLLSELNWSGVSSGVPAERPAEWPLSDTRLDRPHGKPGRFHGLTYTPREYLKWHRPELPALLQFGLAALAWWHREVWQAGSLRKAEHRSFGEYVRSHIADARLFGCEAELDRKSVV